MPKVRLTDPVVRNLPFAPDTYWDASLNGFGVRVSRCSKAFIVLVESGRRKSLGRYPLLPLAKARELASAMLAAKTLGKIVPLHTAFEDAVAGFLSDCTMRNKTRTVNDYARLLKRLNFGRRGIADVKPHHIVEKLNKLNPTPSEKHHTFTALRAFFRWAGRQHYINSNPMEHIYVPLPRARRQRVLNDKEIAATLRLTQSGNAPFHLIVALLLLTGQRRGEIAALQWSWIDFEKMLVTLPATLTKNKREHIFPIGEDALRLIAHIPRSGRYLFPAARDRSKEKPATIFNGWGKSKDAFDHELDIPPWSLHDLRRTFRTKWAELGIPRDVAEKYINHVSGVHSGIEAVYNLHHYLPEMRAATAKWEEFLKDLLRLHPALEA